MSFRAVTLRLRPNKHQQRRLEDARLIRLRPWNRLKDDCVATCMETGRLMSVYDLNDRLTRAAERSGTTIVDVDLRGTSQMCSGCGHQHPGRGTRGFGFEP